MCLSNLPHARCRTLVCTTRHTSLPLCHSAIIRRPGLRHHPSLSGVTMRPFQYQQTSNPVVGPSQGVQSASTAHSPELRSRDLQAQQLEVYQQRYAMAEGHQNVSSRTSPPGHTYLQRSGNASMAPPPQKFTPRAHLPQSHAQNNQPQRISVGSYNMSPHRHRTAQTISGPLPVPIGISTSSLMLPQKFPEDKTDGCGRRIGTLSPYGPRDPTIPYPRDPTIPYTHDPTRLYPPGPYTSPIRTDPPPLQKPKPPSRPRAQVPAHEYVQVDWGINSSTCALEKQTATAPFAPTAVLVGDDNDFANGVLASMSRDMLRASEIQCEEWSILPGKKADVGCHFGSDWRHCSACAQTKFGKEPIGMLAYGRMWRQWNEAQGNAKMKLHARMTGGGGI